MGQGGSNDNASRFKQKNGKQFKLQILFKLKRENDKIKQVGNGGTFISSYKQKITSTMKYKIVLIQSTCSNIIECYPLIKNQYTYISIIKVQGHL